MQDDSPAGTNCNSMLQPSTISGSMKKFILYRQSRHGCTMHVATLLQKQEPICAAKAEKLCNKAWPRQMSLCCVSCLYQQ